HRVARLLAVPGRGSGLRLPEHARRTPRPARTADGPQGTCAPNSIRDRGRLWPPAPHSRASRLYRAHRDPLFVVAPAGGLAGKAPRWTAGFRDPTASKVTGGPRRGHPRPPMDRGRPPATRPDDDRRPVPTARQRAPAVGRARPRIETTSS